MLGFNPGGFMPLGQATDDGIHGEPSEVARELDQDSAATVWMVEIQGVDLVLDQALRTGEGRPDLWERFLWARAL